MDLKWGGIYRREQKGGRKGRNAMNLLPQKEATIRSFLSCIFVGMFTEHVPKIPNSQEILSFLQNT